MIMFDGFEARLSAALDAALARALRAIADDVPADVAVRAVAGGIELTGPDLARRALDDPRLRDFSGSVR